MSLFGSTQFIPDYKALPTIPWALNIFGTQLLTVTPGNNPPSQATYQLLPGKIIRVNVALNITNTAGGGASSAIAFTLPPQYPLAPDAQGNSGVLVGTDTITATTLFGYPGGIPISPSNIGGGFYFLNNTSYPWVAIRSASPGGWWHPAGLSVISLSGEYVHA